DPLSPLLVAILLLTALTMASGSASDPGDSGSSSDDSKGLRGLSTIDASDVFALLFMMVGLAVASAGGVGGGTILVPSMVIMLGFDIKRAAPISNLAIVGGAVANAWFNVRKRHPAVDRPLIDSDLALAMIPLIMGGAVVGAVLAKLLPSYLISLLFVVVLVVGGTRTVMKGIKLHRAETKSHKVQEVAAAAAAAKEEDQEDQRAAAYVTVCSPTDCVADVDLNEDNSSEDSDDDALLSGAGGSSSNCSGMGNDEGVLAQITERERHFSLAKQGVIVLCYSGIVAASIGGAAVSCGGVAYWLLLLLEIPWVLAFAVATAIYLFRQHRRKLSVNYPFVEGDVHWTLKTVVRFPLGCAGAGLVAGLFGVGGGIISGPMMIEMGIVPEVASATTALMVLYSSAAATAKFTVFHMIAWDWATLLCALAFVVTSVSQVFILSFVRRTGRQSIIVLCIGATIWIGTILMTYEAIKTTISDAGNSFTADVCN
ncbi:hypothetical protein BBJ28_00019443, partial [Nothophytophthora sp. Chile5]